MVIKKPPMGWNSWNTFGDNINETLIKETADAFIDNGLKNVGYEYLVIDDCWSERQRDRETDRIIPDKVKFPNGMNAVSDYIHGKGLKFGMYSCTGVRTCADFPGSFGHEFLDAETFAGYGADYLKYDSCFNTEHADTQILYRRMGLALKASGRDILYAACNGGANDISKWARAIGVNMYRSTPDIADNFESFRDIVKSQVDNLSLSLPGCYNDTDMLTVGMYGKGNVGSTGCDDTDYKSQFALWCMMGAPLMIGCDIRNMNDETKALLTNKELIRIDQDEETRPPIVLWEIRRGGVTLFKHLADGDFAFCCFNINDSRKASLVILFDELGIPANSGYGLKLTDIFTGECIGVIQESLSVCIEVHDCKMYRAQLVKIQS